MQPVTIVLILLVVVQVALAAGLIWQRRRAQAKAPPATPQVPTRIEQVEPAPTPAPPSDPPPDPTLPAPPPTDTEPPTTGLPTTEPPITEPPITEPPITEPPITEPSSPRFVLDLTEQPPEDTEEIDEARAVAPTPLILTWHRAGHPPERWHVTVDSVSEDTFAFAGLARRLDLIQIIPRRRVFHTLPFAHDRLLDAEDAAAAAIPDIRAWLAALESEPASET